MSREKICNSHAPKPFRIPSRRSVGIVATTLLSGLVIACAGGVRGTADTTRDSTAASIVPPAGVPDSVPTSVAAVGHHAENAYDKAKLADWTGAQAAVDSLRAVVNLLPDSGVAASGAGRMQRGEVLAETEALQRAVTSRDATVAMRSANRLTELGARLAEPYNPRVPSSVTLLDFYGRELEIWAAGQNRDAVRRLSEVAASVQSTWSGLRPKVIASGGSTEAQRFDSLVAKLSAARTREDYARLATPILDEVDLLERVFAR